MSMSKENSMKQTSITVKEKLRSRYLPSSEDEYRGKKLKFGCLSLSRDSRAP